MVLNITYLIYRSVKYVIKRFYCVYLYKRVYRAQGSNHELFSLLTGHVHSDLFKDVHTMRYAYESRISRCAAAAKFQKPPQKTMT